MPQHSDEILLKLAFERGVLTLLQESPDALPGLHRAISDLDGLIDLFLISKP